MDIYKHVYVFIDFVQCLKKSKIIYLYCIVELLGSNFQKMLDKFLTGIPLIYIHYYTGRKLWCLVGSLHSLVIGCNVLYHYQGSDRYILKDMNTTVFRSFHKSDRSDIFTNAIDICLFGNIMLS